MLPALELLRKMTNDARTLASCGYNLRAEVVGYADTITTSSTTSIPNPEHSP